MDTVRRNLDCGYFGGGGGRGGGAQRCSLPLKLLGVPSMPMSKKHKRTMMGFSPMSEVGRPQTS